jgi:hypothetical protein
MILMHPEDDDWGEMEKLLDNLAKANERNRNEVKEASQELGKIVDQLSDLNVPDDFKFLFKGMLRIFEQVGKNRVAIQELRHDHWLTTQIIKRQIDGLSDIRLGLEKHR